MKIKLLILLMCFLVPELSNAQNTGIGLRLGGLNSGLTIKHSGNGTDAIEGIFSFGYRNFTVTGLYEKYIPIKSTPGLNWFAGAGAHLGFYRYGDRYYIYKRRGNVVYVDETHTSRTVVGIDGILGLNYKFKDAPFDISLDIKPFVDFFEFPNGYFDGGLSFRFVF